MTHLPHLQPDTWGFVCNGHFGTLTITNVDSAGNLAGNLTMADGEFGPITGFWDDDARKITFFRTTAPTQVYTGYLLDQRPGGRNFLAGYFETYPGGGGQAKRSVFGWMADFPHG